MTFESIKTKTETVTQSVKITRSEKVEIVQGKVKEAIKFEGDNQMVKIQPNEEDTCVSDLMKCVDSGFTVTMKVKIFEVREDSFIFSTGAEREDSYGMALKYVAEFNAYKAIVTTADKQWIVNIEASKFITDKWMTLDFSFKVDTGVAVYTDGVLLGRQVKYEKREVKVERSVTSSLFVGHSSTSAKFEETASMLVEVVTFSTATRETLVRAGVVDESKLFFSLKYVTNFKIIFEIAITLW